MSDHDHPDADSAEWDDPDFCPFCGAALSDGGAGFIDHTAERPTCAERFEAWRANVVADVGGEWSS